MTRANPTTVNLMLMLTALLFVTACGKTAAPTAPAPVAPVAATVLQYDINIPDAIVLQQLQTTFPHGVAVAPIPAQLEWNYTCWYKGTPNVYYGPLPAPAGMYLGVNIVIAPLGVANELTFSAAEWPQIAVGMPSTATFTWLGKFVLATPANGLPAYGVCP